MPDGTRRMRTERRIRMPAVQDRRSTHIRLATARPAAPNFAVAPRARPRQKRESRLSHDW